MKVIYSMESDLDRNQNFDWSPGGRQSSNSLLTMTIRHVWYRQRVLKLSRKIIIRESTTIVYRCTRIKQIQPLGLTLIHFNITLFPGKLCLIPRDQHSEQGLIFFGNTNRILFFNTPHYFDNT